MNDLEITKVLTNNGTAIAYELSNGHQIPLEEALKMSKEGLLNYHPFSLDSLPHENINKPSD